MSTNTKVFATLAGLMAMPSVALLSTLAINPDFPIAVYTGYLFTQSALVCAASFAAAIISSVCDLFN